MNSALLSSGETMLRLNILIKNDADRKVSIICKSTLRIQELKRRIEAEFAQLHAHNLIVGLIQDAQGFTLSNNSTIGEHARTGDILFILPQQVDLSRRMNLSGNILQNFTTLRYVANSFSDKLVKTYQSQSPQLSNNLYGSSNDSAKLGDLLPEFLHLGFWYTNQILMLNIAQTLNLMFTPSALSEYYSDNQNEIQKGLLLTLLQFWFQEIDRNPSPHRPLLGQVLEILDKLNKQKPFYKMFEAHSAIKSLVKLAKNQQLDTAVQKRILKIIQGSYGMSREYSHTLRPASKESVSGPSYVPSFLRTSGASDSELEPLLDMINSNSEEQWCLGISMFEKDVKAFATECSVRSSYFEKVMSGLFKRAVLRSAQKPWLVIVQQFIQTATRDRSSQILSKGYLTRIHQFMLESHQQKPRLAAEKLIQTMAKLIDYECNPVDALQTMISPYLTIQLVSLQILLKSSEQSVNLPLFSKHVHSLIKLCLDNEVALEAQRCGYKIIANIVLDKECRYQFINHPLNILEFWVSRLTAGEVEVQRACARTLLNISISSAKNKSLVLEKLLDITTIMYKGILDKSVEKYIETLLKTSAN